MGIFIAFAFALASLVLLNEICKLGPGGSAPLRLRRAARRVFGQVPEARRAYTSEVPGLRWAGERSIEPVAIVWDEPEDTRELWPLSSLADELDDDFDQATIPSRMLKKRP